MNAKTYLQRIAIIDSIILNKRKEIADRELLSLELATRVTSNMEAERVQSSGSKYRMSDPVDKGLDFTQSLKDRIRELEDEKETIIRTMEQLPKKEYDLLYLIYARQMNRKLAGAALGISYSAASKLHQTGIAMVQQVLDERKRNADDQ
jgi:DNA-directed RNA polymerase specialized sigma subunit